MMMKIAITMIIAVMMGIIIMMVIKVITADYLHIRLT